MTISIATCRIQYSGNGVLDTFAYGFRILAAADLKVIVSNDTTGAETVLALNTNYTATGAGSVTGGNVILTSGSLCPTGSTLTIKRNMTITQTNDWVDGQAFSAQSIEDAADKVTMAIQQVNERLGRTPYLRDSYPAIDFKMPNPEASKYLGWNPAATALENKSEPSITTYAVTTIKYLSSYASFAAALSSIGATTSTLVIDTTANITVDTAIPATLQTRVEKIGAFVIATGKTLTINGPFSAGAYQVFNCVGTGAVVMAAGIATEVLVVWWGTDVTAINAAITCASVAGIGVTRLPAGVIDPAGDITIKGDTVLTGAHRMHAVSTTGTILRPTNAVNNAIKTSGITKGWGIKDLQIDLVNAKSTTIGMSINGGAWHFDIDGVSVKGIQTGGTGLKLESNFTSGIYYGRLSNLDLYGATLIGTGVELKLAGFCTGTATSTSVGKLVDSTAKFVTEGLKAGITVSNVTASTTATIASVDSETELTLSGDIFVSGQAYSIIINSGTATSTSAGKLVDSTAKFQTNGITVGTSVYNITDGNTTTVLSVDSENELTLAADNFTIGEAYSISCAKRITQTTFINIKNNQHYDGWKIHGVGGGCVFIDCTSEVHGRHALDIHNTTSTGQIKWIGGELQALVWNVQCTDSARIFLDGTIMSGTPSGGHINFDRATPGFINFLRQGSLQPGFFAQNKENTRKINITPGATADNIVRIWHDISTDMTISWDGYNSGAKVYNHDFKKGFLRNFSRKVQAPTYAASITVDANWEENIVVITVTDAVAFTIANPNNRTQGNRLTFVIINSSGGAMGVITWGTRFKKPAFTNPANGMATSIDFVLNSDATVYYQVGAQSPDYTP